MVYDGDPLRDQTPAAFLDKFVQRKPKPRAKLAGESLMQPAAIAAAAARSAASIGSEAFAALAEDKVCTSLLLQKHISIGGRSLRFGTSSLFEVCLSVQ